MVEIKHQKIYGGIFVFGKGNLLAKITPLAYHLLKYTKESPGIFQRLRVLI